MQHDELIWGCINYSLCSYRAKLDKEVFCRNKYNLTGLCRRHLCPLANSRYATIREIKGKTYLCIKTIERAHTPNRLWELIKLPGKYSKAIELIDQQLEFWPRFYRHKCKQRFTRIRQYLMRMRKIREKPPEFQLVHINKKIEKREAKNEKKALTAAKISNSIEKELLERFRSGLYSGYLNFDQKTFDKTIEKLENEPETEFVVDEEEQTQHLKWEVEDLKKQEKKAEIEIEYEQETEQEKEQQEQTQNSLDW
eukprot:Anaeramoba_ignava/a226446_14.p1 GENE.a226446_14~~a226446_14.p1  ORF type:complete len:253 (+),score=88.11 a226446_14:12-770(+)